MKHLLLLSLILTASCNSGGGGTKTTGAPTVSSLPARVELTGYNSVMVSTSSEDFVTSLFPDFISKAYAANDKKNLVGMDDGEIKKPEFKNEDGSDNNSQVSDVRDVGNGNILMAFFSPGKGHKYGLLKKLNGEIFDISEYLDDEEERFVVIRDHMAYIGHQARKTIYELNLNTLDVRRVNNPAVNPVRFITGFKGSGGGIVIAKDFQNGGYIVMAAMENEAACVGAQGFCLFFDDDSTQPLDNIDSGYPNQAGTFSPWPGMSILYGGDGHIYMWNAGSSYIGGNWRGFGEFYKYEYSKTPFANGKNGKYTKTPIYSITGADLLGFMPLEIPARNNGWYDPNRDKYFVTPQGFSKMVKDPVTGVVTMTWTAIDLREATNSNGPGSNYFCWDDPLFYFQRCEYTTYVYGEYFYWYRNDQIKRLHLVPGATPEVVLNSSDVKNYIVSGDYLIYATSFKTHKIDLRNIAGGSSEMFSQNINIQSPVDL